MKGTKNKAVGQYLALKIRESEFSQTQVSKRLGLAQSVLSRQLNGKESMPAERIADICRILGLPDDEIHAINAMIVAEHDEKSSQFRDVALGLCHKTLDQIGPDGMLLEFMIYWSGLDRARKAALLAEVFKQGHEQHSKMATAAEVPGEAKKSRKE